MNAARLPEARLRYPEWAQEEESALRRVRHAVATGDFKGGSRALADWIDAQSLMLTYIEIDDLPDLRMN